RARAELEDRHRAGAGDLDEVHAVARVEAGLRGGAAEAARPAARAAGRPLTAVVAELHVEIAHAAAERVAQDHLEIHALVGLGIVVADVVPGDDHHSRLKVPINLVAGRGAGTSADV